STLSSATSAIGTFIVGQTTNVAKQISIIIIDVLIMILSVFYFLRDGDKIVAYFKSILPM
ncbi:hypothetical protein COT83_01020, partial [Candidatus Peregrinibacteria bacterium CG10_big_fil_rev_8_21_14_0_10_44_7]